MKRRKCERCKRELLTVSDAEVYFCKPCIAGKAKEALADVSRKKRKVTEERKKRNFAVVYKVN